MSKMAEDQLSHIVSPIEANPNGSILCILDHNVNKSMYWECDIQFNISETLIPIVIIYSFW